MPFFVLSRATPRSLGKGGKNRRRGKNENEKDKRELIFKEDGQGMFVRGSVAQGACVRVWSVVRVRSGDENAREREIGGLLL